MIEVQSLSRYYGDFLAVDQVSFAIPAGEIVGLLGHNGAGKTTIMKMLSGYLEPSAGSITIDGLQLESATRAVQQRLGYLPENLPVYPDMSVADYLDYAATLKGLHAEQRTRSIRHAIEATELGSKLLDRINTLSRGYKQRVGVAQAILGSPRLLILDEPTNGLDPNQTQHMRELIRSLSQQATIILSTHIMQEVDAICDRALILHNGALALNEELQQLRATGHLLLKTNLNSKDLTPALAGLDAIHGHTLQHSGDNRYSYQLQLQDNADAEQVAAAVAERIAAAAGALYQLSAESRDLETVFREVNAIEENANAA